VCNVYLSTRSLSHVTWQTDYSEYGLVDLPSLNNPSRNMIQPTRKHNRTAKSGLFWTTKGFVKIPMMAVGPIFISLQVPRIIYTKQPINDEYSPYCNRATQALVTLIYINRILKCSHIKYTSGK